MEAFPLKVPTEAPRKHYGTPRESTALPWKHHGSTMEVSMKIPWKRKRHKVEALLCFRGSPMGIPWKHLGRIA